MLQNAYTSADETVYELLVPIDKPGLLRQACTVFAEFATKVIIADADLERERGAVLEEWRQVCVWLCMYLITIRSYRYAI